MSSACHANPPLMSNIRPRGVSRLTAAFYVGIDPASFDEMVRDGRMPAPKVVDTKLIGAYLDTHSRIRTGTATYGYTFVGLAPQRSDCLRHPALPLSKKNTSALLQGSVQSIAIQPTTSVPGTLSWLFDRYYQSAEFKRLNASTQHVRRLILGHIAAADGTKPYKLLETKHVRRMRDLKADKPEAANGRVKVLRAVFGWAVLPGVELAIHNPARNVPYIVVNSEGHHSWTDAEVSQFEARHPVGTPARLAMALLLYTSQRRSDVALFGPKHLHNGWLHFTQQKNRVRKPIYLEIPIQPALKAILDATPLGKDTFLVNALGNAFTVAGFGNWFRSRCDEAELSHCSAHGLRKAAARLLAENNRSSHQIMAITGHKTLKEVDRYTRAVDQRKLAAQAFAGLS